MAAITRSSLGTWRQQTGKTSRGLNTGFINEVVAGGATIFASVGPAVAQGVAATVTQFWVDPSNVKLGVVYGPTGTEFTGTYSGGGGGVSRSRVTNA
jgi:hypothetical protein